MTSGRFTSPRATPPEFEEVDIGEDRPVRCLKVGLWLVNREGNPCAVLLAPDFRPGTVTGIKVQVATRDDDSGIALADTLFDALETAIREARCYRGKILSLEREESYTGQTTGIKVHKLRPVAREQVILPKATLDLLDRNVLGFIRQRQRLAAIGQSTKKGLLFYGPPGTGKSHTIHYLAGALTGHTTLLITAEQVGSFGEYMALARLLQPSVVVIEDADLIARDRTQMHGPCDEALLNKLLNEMDGLRETAQVLFILTTNRPEALEAALTSRPGRIDQAIEFPLPDRDGRERLVRLYSTAAQVSEDVIRMVVDRTEGVSAAFVKELMRRSVQFQLERDGSHGVTAGDVENALNEMLFAGGKLNVKLLGGSLAAVEPPRESRPEDSHALVR